MKKLIVISVILTVLHSCTVTIPLQTNLSDQTMLLAENKNIKANVNLISKVPDGNILFKSVQKDGTESSNSTSYIYASETAFKKLWGSYISSKFNNYSKDEIDIVVTLEDLVLRQQAATSIGMTVLTGNSKVNVDAIAIVHAVVEYKGKKYENKFEVTASEYNESQQMKAGNSYYTMNQTNPTQQQSKLLESCLNKSIINFENFIKSVLVAAKEEG